MHRTVQHRRLPKHRRPWPIRLLTHRITTGDTLFAVMTAAVWGFATGALTL